jgi:hypothetical protein
MTLGSVDFGNDLEREDLGVECLRSSVVGADDCHMMEGKQVHPVGLEWII